MVKIMKELWGVNQDKLRKALSEDTNLNSCDYEYLLKLVFNTIYNTSDEGANNPLDLNRITVIDDGGYQGTLLFLIPFDTYQPSEGEYIMTYIGYGSCSGCDALQAAQAWEDGLLTEEQVTDFMVICKDLICNSIKPYNCGWRNDEKWLPAEFD